MTLGERERAVLGAAIERLVPGGDAVGYIDQLLHAFDWDPPRIWAGGPFSGRHGGAASFEDWIPLGPLEERAWRERIASWQQQYAALLESLGPDFTEVDGDEQDRRLVAEPALRQLLYEHACEGTYGDPVYGGNTGAAVWDRIGWVGDVLPRGYTDVEVSQREKTPVERRG